MKPEWLRQAGTSGAIAFAALAVAVLSGVGLALPFDSHNAYDSVALLLLTNPGARFYRNVHYWSGQLFLVSTLVHVWRHMARSSERRMRLAVWIRTTLLIPFAALLMVSGFMLKGDAEGLQAFRIISTACAQVPIVGRGASIFFFGADQSSLQIVYLHHAATITLITWLLVAEHGRAVWPRLASIVFAAAPLMAVAFVASPGLHDPLDPVIKGPWYFVGLQEVLHHASRPNVVTVGAVLFLVSVTVMPALSVLTARRIKIGLVALLIGYGAVSLAALGWRGENWTLAAPTVAFSSGLSLESPMRVPPLDSVRTAVIPVVLGRREGCLACHAGTTGLSAAHRPEAVGCSSCHGGNPFSLDRTIAHRGVILVPGNLDAAARTCGPSECHSAAVARVRQSIMTTMSGVIAVDRATFGESHLDKTPTGPATLGSSPADTHLRQLCVSCHLGAVKKEPAPIDETSRGGGCNACHLAYSREASDWLRGYLKRRAAVQRPVEPRLKGGIPNGTDGSAESMVHPNLTAAVTDDHCFGCHSRSGRVSLSYAGWREGDQPEAGRSGETRALADGRVLYRETADVHSEKGMSCVDCHTSRELMGDGTVHSRKDQQASVACEDCHSRTPRVARHDQVDDESRRILNVRERFHAEREILVTARNGEALTNTWIDASGKPFLSAKQTGLAMELRRPAPPCENAASHGRLSCVSCHQAWAPRCVTCHTTFDQQSRAYDYVSGNDATGAWNETTADTGAERPTLGVRMVPGPGNEHREAVDPFIPGMILTIDRRAFAGASKQILFRRLYARAISHTTSARARGCKTCHNDPIALGYGQGSLVYGRGSNGGRWTFSPARMRSPFDGLPNDAWIGFLEQAAGPRSTRPDVRPFTAEEQKRILTVGACLTCHAEDSSVMRAGLTNFSDILRKATSRCLLPRWN